MKPAEAAPVVVEVVDCVDFDGSIFPKRAVKSLFRALEDGKKNPKLSKLPKLVLVATKELKKQDLDLANEVDELLRLLLSIKAMVEGIELERRQEEIPGATKEWLHHVEKVVYDVNDLLDEIVGNCLMKMML
ncbi:hypothetical protein J5N97_014365 [Dioscorea zingiberensis]|uniref:Disease resistance N-terminal domain-containing protein n=1 Tax=Dioscorea zingiberensis TaxID=325984 RepID=A0A9D5CSC5_9LILI|nr:hypothetical protein J5N97_014365 [Dioscorea zingiberensis]